MKSLPILLLLIVLSVTASAQFPLGSTIPKIKAYFDKNIPYASVQEFSAEPGDTAICFTKVKVVGDFTFYFDHDGLCTSYIVTYDKQDQDELVYMLDHNYCHLENTKWASEEGKFDAVLLPAAKAANYVSIVYKPKAMPNYMQNTLASN